MDAVLTFGGLVLAVDALILVLVYRKLRRAIRPRLYSIEEGWPPVGMHYPPPARRAPPPPPPPK